MAQLDACPTGDQVAGSTSAGNILLWRLIMEYFVEIDRGIFSTVSLCLPLIQEGQLSISGERIGIMLVYRLEDYACPVSVVR